MPPRPRTVPRKQPRQARSQALVDAILTATARVLVRDGYDRCSTNRVATAAGVSVGSLYQYFPSKEALVAALLERHTEAVHAVFAEKLLAVGESSPRETAREIISAIIASHAVDPKLHRVLAEQVPRVGRLQKIDALHARGELLVRDFLASHPEGRRVDDVELAAFMIFAVVQAVVQRAVREQPELLEGDRLVTALTDLVYRWVHVVDDAVDAPRSKRGRAAK